MQNNARSVMARHALFLTLALAQAACSFAQVATAGAATTGAAAPAVDDKHPCIYEPPQQVCHADTRTGTTGCEDKGAWCERPNDVQNARKVMLVFAGVFVGYAVLVVVNSRRRMPASSEELPLLAQKPGQIQSAPQEAAGETYMKATLFCCCPCLWRTRQDQYTSAAFLTFLFAWLLTSYFFIKPCLNDAPFFSFCSGAGSDAYTCVLTPDSTACVAQF